MSDNRPSIFDTHLEPRVASLEGEMRQLISTVNKLADHVDKSYTSLSNKIDTIIDRQSIASKPNWILMTSLAAVVLSIVTYLGNLTINPIKDDIHEVKALMTTDHQDVQKSKLLWEITLDKNKNWPN